MILWDVTLCEAMGIPAIDLRWKLEWSVNTDSLNPISFYPLFLVEHSIFRVND